MIGTRCPLYSAISKGGGGCGRDATSHSPPGAGFGWRLSPAGQQRSGQQQQAGHGRPGPPQCPGEGPGDCRLPEQGSLEKTERKGGSMWTCTEKGAPEERGRGEGLGRVHHQVLLPLKPFSHFVNSKLCLPLLLFPPEPYLYTSYPDGGNPTQDLIPKETMS